MAKVFFADFKGFAELRNSPGVKALVDSAAQKTSNAASGMNCVIKTHSSGGAKSRYWASVYPGDVKSRVINAKTNGLLKAIGSVRV